MSRLWKDLEHWFRLAIQTHFEHVLTHHNYVTRPVVTSTRRARYVPPIGSQLGNISYPTVTRMSAYMTFEVVKTL
jgi:hypothetical protein